MVLLTKNIIIKKRFQSETIGGITGELAPFFMGSFESRAPQVRTESNRVLFNMTAKSGQPIALGPGPRYRDVTVMPIRDKDK